MFEFNKLKTKDLKNWLYKSHVHDAQIHCITYNPINQTLLLEIFNPMLSTKMHFSFCEIKLVLYTKNTSESIVRSIDAINSLTVEEDVTSLCAHLDMRDDYCTNYLYLLFQLFSGDELHIVSKRVFVE